MKSEKYGPMVVGDWKQDEKCDLCNVWPQICSLDNVLYLLIVLKVVIIKIGVDESWSEFHSVHDNF